MDLVWFAEIKWDYLRTRKQQLIRRKPEDVRLLYLEPFVRGKPNDYRIRETDGIRVVTVPFLKSVPDPLVRAALNSSLIRYVVNRQISRKVSTYVRQCGMSPSDTGFMLSNVFAIDVARSLQRRILVYDCNDAHSAFPGMPGWVDGCFRKTCRRSDHVVVSSDQLLEDVVSVGAVRDDVTLIGNGVEYQMFASRRTINSDQRSSPTIGYLGAIAPWFDFDMVHALAKARPDWKIDLVGPVMQGADSRVAELLTLGNVTISGAVSHDDVPEIMSRFTVGLIPFLFTDLTRGVNPNKMYEYLAAGVPVVATKFSEYVSRYPGVVWASSSADEFINSCDAAVAAARGDNRDEFVARADAVAKENDWDIIADRFWARVQELYRSRG